MPSLLKTVHMGITTYLNCASTAPVLMFSEGTLGSCAGQMKDILTTGLGMFLFGDVKFEAKNVAGVCVGLLGGIAYSLISYRDSRLQKRSATRK